MHIKKYGSVHMYPWWRGLVVLSVLAELWVVSSNPARVYGCSFD
jgi:hypothetical protein